MATYQHASDRMRQREVFHPKRISTAEERLARAEVADRGVHATWAARALVAHTTVSELVEAYGGRDMEIDWFYTDQYNGHNSYHAAAERRRVLNDVGSEDQTAARAAGGRVMLMRKSTARKRAREAVKDALRWWRQRLPDPENWELEMFLVDMAVGEAFKPSDPPLTDQKVWEWTTDYEKALKNEDKSPNGRLSDEARKEFEAWGTSPPSAAGRRVK